MLQYANTEVTALPSLCGGRGRTEHTPVFSSENPNVGKYKSLPFHLHLWKECCTPTCPSVDVCGKSDIGVFLIA